MAMACPFIDASNISLAIALACEIAANAEDIVEAGGTYTANVGVGFFKGRDLAKKRLEMIRDEQGFEGIYKDIQKSKDAYRSIKKAIRGGVSWGTDEFLTGNMPLDASMEHAIMYYLTEGYTKADFPVLSNGMGSMDKTARGILRDLGVEMKDSQLIVKFDQKVSQDPMRVAVTLDGKVFFEDDPLVLNRDFLRPPASIPGQNFLLAKGESIFRRPYLHEQDLSVLAKKLQSLNGALNHPDEDIRTEAQEWLKTDQGVAYLYRYIGTNPDSASNEVKAAARGFIKRILKDYDNATFDEGRYQAAKKFFGKDTKMLLQKCWNKSDMKNAFGQFKVSDEMLEIMLLSVCKNVAPLRRSKDQIARIRPELLTGVVAVIMVDCALKSMGVKLNHKLRQLWML